MSDYSQYRASLYAPNPHSTSSHAAWAVGEMVFAPQANKIMSRLFVRSGITDPTECMRRANNLLTAERFYFFVMILTGQVALAVAGGGAGMVVESAKTNGDYLAATVWFIAMGAALGWLYGLRLVHGRILHHFFKDAPNPLWKSNPLWPVTARSGLKVTRIPAVLADQSINSKEKAIDVVGTLLWFGFVKIPLVVFAGILPVYAFFSLFF